MLDQLVNMTLAAQAAEKEGLAKDPDVQARLDLLRTQILAEAASEKYVEGASGVRRRSEGRVRHAGGARCRRSTRRGTSWSRRRKPPRRDHPELQAGGDFAKLAEGSRRIRAAQPRAATSAGSRRRRWSSRSPTRSPRSRRARYTTAPVQSEYGCHVILLEDTRAPQAPAFEDVKEQVKMFAQRKKLQAYLDELRKTAKIQKTG